MGKKLSIFIDESGDFGKYDPKSPFYILTLVFLENADVYQEEMNNLRIQLNYIGVNDHYVFHLGPLIRNENEYQRYSLEKRKILFNKIFTFTRKTKMPYYSIIIEKNKNINKNQLMQNIYEKMNTFLIYNFDTLLKCDEIILYYDKGQIEISSILKRAFLILSYKFSIEIKKNNDFIYFQVAAFICTMEYIYMKKFLTTSEKLFFKDVTYFNKNYYRFIKKNKIKEKIKV